MESFFILRKISEPKKIMAENNFREGANNNPGEFVLEKAFVD